MRHGVPQSYISTLSFLHYLTLRCHNVSDYLWVKPGMMYLTRNFVITYTSLRPLATTCKQITVWVIQEWLLMHVPISSDKLCYWKEANGSMPMVNTVAPHMQSPQLYSELRMDEFRSSKPKHSNEMIKSIDFTSELFWLRLRLGSIHLAC